MQNIITYLFVFFLLNIQLFAQQEEYSLSQLKGDDGLSQTTILNIIQDYKGYMWFGTGNGLNKYDGYSFTVYNNIPHDSTSISSNSITSLFEDSQKNIWVGTSDGFLNKYIRAKDIFVRINISGLIHLPNSNEESYYDYPIAFSRNALSAITSIAEDKYGNLWLGTWGKGIVIFNKQNNKIISYQNNINDKSGLSYNRISKILIDDSTIWIATLGGGLNRVLKYNGNSKKMVFENFLPIANEVFSITGKRIMSLSKDVAGNIWAGCYDGSLNMISSDNKNKTKSNVKFLNPKNKHFLSLSNKSIMTIISDNEGYLWVGTFGYGLYRLDAKTETTLAFNAISGANKIIIDKDILSLYQDRGNIVWVGTHLGEGLSKIYKKNNKFFLLKNILPFSKQPLDDVVWAILDDNKGNIYVGTYRSGLQIYNENTKTIKSIYAGAGTKNLSDNHIRSLLLDNFGNLWIGTYNGGLNKLNIKTGKIFKYLNNPLDKNSIGGNQIQALYADKNNTLWIATFGGGLNYISLNSKSNKYIFHKYVNKMNDDSSISDNRVYSILEDRQGNLWVGTFGGGLNLLNKNNTFKRFKNNPNNPKSLSNDKVISIYEDSNNSLWIGTYGGGLNRFVKSENEFIKYSPNNLFESDVIYGILEDTQKHIWLSTNNGIYKLNLQNFAVTHFDLKDGLQSREFSGGAYYKSNNGKMYFGGIKGVNYFYPEKLTINSNIPQIAITAVKVFGKTIKGDKNEIFLKYNENYLSLEFASLDFSNPKDNHYQYKLEGVDEDWQMSSSAIRTAFYTNLSPGEYVFRVIGSNNDEVWNKEGAAINITILPPFWKRWWFVLIIIILVAGAATVFYLARIRNIRFIESLKSKLSADLHDSVGSGLTEISILSEITASQTSNSSFDIAGNLRTISDKSRFLIDNMSDIVWVVNPKRDTLNDLILRLNDYYADLFSAMNISFKTNFPDDFENIKLAMDYKQNLYLLLKEAINNAIKHSGCKRITLDVISTKKEIEILLSDDGDGFVKQDNMKGNGLNNIEKRAKVIGACAVISSVLGKGTSILFKGKIKNLSKIRAIFEK